MFKSVEHIIESTILASRWLLAVFCLGIAAALGLYALVFLQKLFLIGTKLFSMEEAEVILSMLNLIDAALVASLMVMVMISSYENFVSQFDGHNAQLAWLGTIGTGSLKIKIASAIVAISSIHLLSIFLNLKEYTGEQVLYAMLLHITFIISAVCLGGLELMTGYKKTPEPNDQAKEVVPTPH